MWQAWLLLATLSLLYLILVTLSGAGTPPIQVTPLPFAIFIPPAYTLSGIPRNKGEAKEASRIYKCQLSWGSMVQGGVSPTSAQARPCWGLSPILRVPL